MNAKQWISSQCSVLFEETTLKAIWVPNSLLFFHCGGVDGGGLSAGNNGNYHQSNFYSPHHGSSCDSSQHLQCLSVGRRFSDLHQTLFEKMRAKG